MAAQEKETISFTNKPLDEILFELETLFNIKFSYNAKLVKGKIISIPKTKLSLTTLLNEIKKQTSIVYTKTNDRHYVITSQKNLSGSICGYIYNAKDMTPIADADVINKKTHEITASHDSGFFEIQYTSANDKIEIQLLGYQKKRIHIAKFIANSDCLKISLKESFIALKKVIITDYLANGVSKDKDGSINALPSKLQILPGLIEPDILQSLQLIPGIQTTDESSTALNIRRGTPDQNLILWDGIKMYHYGHFFGMLSSFNPYITNDVKLFKSGMSAKYGNAISGVVDISSDTKIPVKTSGGGGFNMIYGDFYIKTPINPKSAIIASARRSYTDIVETITFDRFSEHIFQNTKIKGANQTFNERLSKTNNTYYFTDFTAKSIYKPKENDLFSISTTYSKNKLLFVSQFDQIDQNTSDKLNIENKGVSLNWKKQWTPKLSHSFKTFYSNYNFDYLGEELLSVIFDYQVIKKNSIKEFGALFLLDHSLDSRQSFTTGYELSNIDLSYALGNTSDVIFENNFVLQSNASKNTSHSLFGTYRYDQKKWALNGGCRVNYFSNVNRFVFEPRLMAKVTLSPSVNIKLTAHQLYQNISQIIEFETQNLGLENQIWVLANNDVVPLLKSHQIDMGLTYTKNNWYFDIEGYYKKISGITSVTKGFNQEVGGYSMGETNTYGIDILLKKKIQHYSNWISYSLSTTQSSFDNLNNGRSFPGNFDIRHYLSWVQTFSLEDFEFSLGWKYRTSIPYTPAYGVLGNTAENLKIDYGEINSNRLKDYHRMDFSATYKFDLIHDKNIKGKIGFSLLNIYDKKNTLNRSYRIFVDTSIPQYELKEIDKYSLGITPNMVFRIDF
ncbi:TonB-dependent receptor [Aquimarina sp. 2201CG1-2-11]|uniref:TonB-dependent receptor plug domain-containing protein n=1 Tax=Aquimarina discodermiae TaxID=3231043 RepID=UPI0034625AA2